MTVRPFAVDGVRAWCAACGDRVIVTAGPLPRNRDPERLVLCTFHLHTEAVRCEDCRGHGDVQRLVVADRRPWKKPRKEWKWVRCPRCDGEGRVFDVPRA